MSTNDYESPVLKQCKGCELNIARVQKGECLVYIESEKSRVVPYRKEKDIDNNSLIKLYIYTKALIILIV